MNKADELLQVFPAESMYVDGANRHVELRQYHLYWFAYAPQLGVGARSEGPNQAVRALRRKLKEES